MQEFHKLMAKAKAGKDHDDIFDQLKAAVVETAMGRHLWEDKAAEMLRVSSREDRLGLQLYLNAYFSGNPVEYIGGQVCP